MPKIDFINLETSESPREILEHDFPRLGKLPFRGGWGYDQATACIIDKNDPSVPKNLPFDGVGLEYLFSEYRNYEELIIFRPEGEKYAGIKRELSRQSLKKIGTLVYDVLEFEIQAFREEDFFKLKAKYEGPDGIRNPRFDKEAHHALHNSLLCTATREYWFDITSFYGTR